MPNRRNLLRGQAKFLTEKTGKVQVAASDFILLLLCLLSHQKQAHRGTPRCIEAVRAVASLLQRICDWREANITATGTIRPTESWVGLGTLASYESQSLSQKEKDKKKGRGGVG